MHPSEWPFPLVGAIFVAVVVPAVLLAASVRVRLLRRWFGPPSAELHVGSYEAVKTLGQLTGIFLIFVLVQGMTYFHAAEVAVSREAVDILQLDRSLAELDAGPARAQLQSYVRALVQQEWPAMRRGAESPETEAALTRLQDAVEPLLATAVPPATLQGLEKGLNDVEDDRAGRLGVSADSLPAPLWWVTVALFCLIVANASLLQPMHGALLSLGFYAAGLALLAALLFMLDGPYRGRFSVPPAPLQRALASLEHSAPPAAPPRR